MNAPRRITADVDDVTLAKIAKAAADLGQSPEEFASDALRRAADEAIARTDWIAEGRRQIAAGEYREHDAFMADLKRWRERRIRPA